MWHVLVGQTCARDRLLDLGEPRPGGEYYDSTDLGTVRGPSLPLAQCVTVTKARAWQRGPGEGRRGVYVREELEKPRLVPQPPFEELSSGRGEGSRL